MYTRKSQGKPRVYATVSDKPAYKKKKMHKFKVNRQAETKFTPIRLYQAYMPPYPTQKQEREREQFKYIECQEINPQRTITRNSPVWSPILLWGEIPMAWGTTTDS